MPRRKKVTIEPVTPPAAVNSSRYEERRQLAERIEKTAAVLCEMLETLKKHGAKQELIARAEQGLEFGIIAALWSLDYIDEQGNPVQF